MENKKRLIYAEDAKRTIEHYDPAFSCYIDNVPTADVAEIKHGHWIANNKEAICSACKFTTFEWAEWTFNYCPNCGTKMEV